MPPILMNQTKSNQIKPVELSHHEHIRIKGEIPRGKHPLPRRSAPVVFSPHNSRSGLPPVADKNLIRMSEHQKDTEFLRRIIVYGDTEEHHELEKRIAQVQRDEQCVQRVTLAAVLFTLAAIVGLAYMALLEENFPYNESQLLLTILYALFLASLICLVAFSVLLMVYRKRLNRMREECRHLVTKLVEFHVRTSKSEKPERTPGTAHSAVLTANENSPV